MFHVWMEPQNFFYTLFQMSLLNTGKFINKFPVGRCQGLAKHVPWVNEEGVIY